MSFQKDMEVFRELVKESAENKEKNLKRFSSKNFDEIPGSGSSSGSSSESGSASGSSSESETGSRIRNRKNLKSYPDTVTKSGTDPEPGPDLDLDPQFPQEGRNWDARKATRRGPDQEGRASEPVAFPKEKRRAQIDLGHLVIDYFKEEPFVVKDPVKRTGPGRPRKLKSEQVKTLAIKIRPEYIDLLKNLSFGRGMGTRIRMIIDQWNALKKREKGQIEVLKKAIGELDGAIKRYARDFKRAENLERNEIVIKQMEKACNNIKILMNVLKFEVREMEGMLSREEFKNLEFSYHYKG